jgi:hypothetical protein
MRNLIVSLAALCGIFTASPDAEACSHVGAQFGAACPICNGAPAAGGFSSYGYSASSYAQPMVQAPAQTFAVPVQAPVQQSQVTYQSTASYQAPMVVAAPAPVTTSYYAASYAPVYPGFAAPAYGGYSGVGLGGGYGGYGVGLGVNSFGAGYGMGGFAGPGNFRSSSYHRSSTRFRAGYR